MISCDVISCDQHFDLQQCEATLLLYERQGSTWPSSAAAAAVAAYQGQPLARAHCTRSKCPPATAIAHVRPSQGQLLACSHCNTSK
jgi:hypothetical protein